MNISNLGNLNTHLTSRQPEMVTDLFNEPLPAQPSDSVDFSDGANNAVEIALLPSVDILLGQIVSEGVQQGNVVRVSGKITTDNDKKQLAQINYEMKPNLAAGKLNTKGSLLSDPENNVGTFVNEETGQNPNNALSATIEGVVSTKADNTEKNEDLKVTVGMGSFLTQGTVNGFGVEEQSTMDFFGTINQQGIIADQPFQRKIMPDFSTGGAQIQGQMGDMQETGKVGMSGNGILIDRQIGPYHIQEQIVFSPTKKQ